MGRHFSLQEKIMEQTELTAAATQVHQSPDAVQAFMRFLRSFCRLNENFNFHSSAASSQKIASDLWEKLLPCIELYLTEALKKQHRVSFEFTDQNTHYGAFGLSVLPPGLDEFLCFFQPHDSYSLITLTLEAQSHYSRALQCPVIVIADGYVTFGPELLWLRPIS
jgi:hypothetical protein